MNIAFCLYKYFPYGGLQRDFLRIALACQARGHHIRVYAMSWEGERPEQFEYIQVPTSAHTNHGRNKEYSDWVSQELQRNPADVIVGFNKMPGLDYYYAADVCYAEKVEQEKGFLYRLTSRYKHYAEFERAVFSNDSRTELLMLTGKQIADFKKHYQTKPERFHIVPPGISLDRKYDYRPANAREDFRQRNHTEQDELLILQVGSDFKRKGVDRTLRAVSALPAEIKAKTKLIVVGQDKPKRYQALAEKLSIASQVAFYSGRDDIPELMAAADILMHPAYQESAGIVLIEAIAAGLPVITTETCGYAHHVASAECGVVISEPFEQNALNGALARGLGNKQLRATWSEHAKKYADSEDLYSLPERAADLILGGKND